MEQGDSCGLYLKLTCWVGVGEGRSSALCRPRKSRGEFLPEAWVSMATAVGQTPAEKLEENQHFRSGWSKFGRLMGSDQVKRVSGEWPPQGGRSGLRQSLLHVARPVLAFQETLSRQQWAGQRLRGTPASRAQDEPTAQSTALHETPAEKLEQPSRVAVFIERKEFHLFPRYSALGC